MRIYFNILKKVLSSDESVIKNKKAKGGKKLSQNNYNRVLTSISRG